jgi:hypothetical protein
MKGVIVSACYAIIAALISKRYLIFSSVSVVWVMVRVVMRFPSSALIHKKNNINTS